VEVSTRSSPRGGRIGLAGILGAALALAACGNSKEQDRRAYEACLAAAKAPGQRFAEARFESFENSKVAGSAAEEEIRVSIPYELAGQKGLYQCIAQKQSDGSFKAVF
jgi:hypothetical protein